jgi:predicted amidophosphoribosyltransferase
MRNFLDSISSLSSFKLLDSLSSLIYPKSCISCHEVLNLQIQNEASCEANQVGLCLICFLEIIRKPTCEYRYGITIYSGSRFSPKVSRIILAAKEDNNLLARKWLVDSLKIALAFAWELINESEKVDHLKIALVPIPSRNSVNRSRGYRHTNLLAAHLSKEWVDSDLKIFPDLLSYKLRVRDQSRLGFEERRNNMNGSMIVSENRKISGYKVFLLDDLVTSGLTLRAAKITLESNGVAVTGALCAASALVFGNLPNLKIA